MGQSLIILKQIGIMFILMMIGFLLYKGKKLDNKGTKSISNLLIYIILPAVIINGFIVDATKEKMIELLISAAMALACLLAAVLISHVCFKRNPIENFAATFSNPGFFGIPIIVSTFSAGSVFAVTAFVAFLNIGQWTYGVSVLKEEKMQISLKTIIKSPFIIGLIIGLAIFFTRVPVPAFLKTTISTVTNANTPLAMILIGTYLAQADLKDIFINPHLYAVSAVRLLVIPVVSLLLLCLVPNAYYETKMCVLIAAACPVGANVAVYAQLHNKDYAYSVETVTQSTIFSALTIPLMTMLAEFLWKLPVFG